MDACDDGGRARPSGRWIEDALALRIPWRVSGPATAEGTRGQGLSVSGKTLVALMGEDLEDEHVHPGAGRRLDRVDPPERQGEFQPPRIRGPRRQAASRPETRGDAGFRNLVAREGIDLQPLDPSCELLPLLELKPSLHGQGPRPEEDAARRAAA